MRILASGCSFTVGGPKASENWASNIGRRNVVKNLAKSSAGNRYIGQSVMLELIRDSRAYDMVLVMWSGLQRIDLMVNDLVYDSLENINTATVDGVYCYAFLGDAYSHKHNKDILRPPAKELFKVSNEEINGCNSILEMINLQDFLKHNSVPYRFMSYVNYWNDSPQVTNLNFGLYKYPSCQRLVDYLDFDNFLFYNEFRDCFYEFSRDRKLIGEDGFHPNQQAHEEWATFIREQI